MIRVVTLDEFDPKQLEKFQKTLFTAFGVGAEHSGHVEVPTGLSEPIDPEVLLAEVRTVRAYADDKLLYLTKRKLKDRQLVSGIAPSQGFSTFGKERAVVSTAGFKDLETSLKPIGRHALHHIGHLWELHHCLDPRCSMYPPWTPSFTQGDTIFCTFCRDKSDQKIRLGNS